MAAVTQRVFRQSIPAGPWNLPGFGICVAILVLNLLDALFTMAFLKFNFAEEANPLMNLAYRTSPIGFVLLKLAMVQVGILILHHHRRGCGLRWHRELSSGIRRAYCLEVEIISAA